MVKETKITLRTRHINCSYCISLTFFILSIILFALSSEQTKVLENRKSVIISASIILLLSIIIFIWITYYAIGYFRLKKHQQINNFKKQENQICESSLSSSTTTIKTSVVIFDNAAFTNDDSLQHDRPTSA